MQTWRVAARAGGQAFSHIRRDVLHPLGTDGARPYAEFTGEAVTGPIALVSRLAAEPRLSDDPEWPGRRDLELLYRFPEAYLSAQFKYGSVFYGQMERNWGPVGLSGIGVSNYAYPQVEAGLLVGVPSLQLEAYARQLRDEADSLGRTVHRYFFAHRVGARLSDRLRVGLWETSVISGIDREFDGRYRNPLSLLLFANQYGLGANGNVLFGLDASLALPRARHAAGTARHRRPAVREHLRRDTLSEPVGPHARRLRPARPLARVARILHPGLEPGLPHAGSVRELHRRRGRDRPQLRRHGPTHPDGQPPLCDALAGDARAHPAAPGRGRHQRPVSGQRRRSRTAAPDLHRRSGAYLARGRRPARPPGAAGSAPERRASTTSSTRTTRRAAP